VHFGLKAFQERNAVEVTPSGENEMLCVGWLPYQPSYAFDDVSTAVFDRALVIVIPSPVLNIV
jgi:hypothetical protein